MLKTSFPSGTIGAFNLQACPQGWEAFSEATGRVIVGGHVGKSVGTALKNGAKRTISQVPKHSHRVTLGSHKHKIKPPKTITDTTGSHTHKYTDPTIGKFTLQSDGNGHTKEWLNFNAGTTTAAGNHSHSVDISEFDSSTTNLGTVTSNDTGESSVDVTMPYVQLKICQFTGVRF